MAGARRKYFADLAPRCVKLRVSSKSDEDLICHVLRCLDQACPLGLCRQSI